MSWEGLWKFVLLLTLGGYSILVVIVFFGGLRNIVQMLRELRQPLDSTSED